MRTKRVGASTKRRRNTRKHGGGYGFFPTPRREIQLFTKAEETGILTNMLTYLNGKPNILDDLALPENIKKYIRTNKKGAVDAAKGDAATATGQLTPDIFKYKIDSAGIMNDQEVLTKKEMKLYIFPLLIQLEEILLNDAQIMTDENNKKSEVKDYHNFTMGLVRSVSSIINPLWFDAIESYLSFINFDKIPGVSAAKQHMASLGETISSAMANKDAGQGVKFDTNWYRGYPDDKHTDPLDLDNVSYFPIGSMKYMQNDDIKDINQILNSMYYLGDKEQLPIANEVAKHSLTRGLEKTKDAKK